MSIVRPEAWGLTPSDDPPGPIDGNTPWVKRELDRYRQGEGVSERVHGWVDEMLTADEAKAARVQREESLWLKRCERIGVPVRLRPTSFLSHNQTPALARAERYAREEMEHGRCLVLAGPTGVGKSWAAAAVLRNAKVGRFLYFPALCGALLDPHRREEALEHAKDERLTVFDDLGVEYVKEGGLVDAFLDEIIWHREANVLPTVITTNLTRDALEQRLSGRIYDRLRGDWGIVYECPGESLR